MTALAQIAGIDARVRQDRRPLLGFGTFFRKELTEWVLGRRAIVIGLAATAFATLGALSAWLQATFGELELTVGDRAQDAARTYSTDPTVTTMAIFGTPIISVMAIFAGMSLLAAERESGTLAWSLTKPLSRTAILLAKWLAAVIAFGLAAVVIPIVAAAVASTLAYGATPDLAFVARTAAFYLAVPVLYIGFAVFAGTAISSQAGVAGLGMVLLLAPALVGSVLPAQLVDALPVGIGEWAIGFAAGEPVPLSTLLGLIVSMTIFLVGGIALFRRQEL